MNLLLLAALLMPSPALAEDAELVNDVEIRRELEKAETENLENAAAGSIAESARTVRFIRAIIVESLANLEAARVELETALRDPEELRRQLGDDEGDPTERIDAHHEALLLSGQLLVAKSEDFIVKASSVPLAVPEEDHVKLIALRSAYSAKNRDSDLRRALSDAAAARKRLGIQDLWGTANEAVGSLGSCAAEATDAAKHVEASAQALAGRARRADVLMPAREHLAQLSKALKLGAKDLDREVEILKASLLLQKADRQITGRLIR